MKRIAISVLAIGMSLILLWHFSNIWRFGKHFIQEPNTAILIAETILFLGVLIFSVYSLIKEIGKIKS